MLDRVQTTDDRPLSVNHCSSETREEVVVFVVIVDCIVSMHGFGSTSLAGSGSCVAEQRSRGWAGATLVDCLLLSREKQGERSASFAEVAQEEVNT